MNFISLSFRALGNVPTALRELEEKLASGAWARRCPDLLDLEERDRGYSLVVTH